MIKRLEEWRAARNITEPSGLIVDILQEEVNEIEVEVKANNVNNLLGELADIIIVAANEIGLMGYDMEKVVLEKIKVIDSREQNPNQKEIWDKWGASGKWEKNKDQCKSTLYTAAYSKCKIV